MNKSESACKPGSVKNGHLSVACDCSQAQATSRERPGRPCALSTVLLRIEFTAPACLHAAGELLPRLSTLTAETQSVTAAVYLCCTCPRVTPGGRYPLSLPCGARTFLTHRLSPCARGRSADLRRYSKRKEDHRQHYSCKQSAKTL